MDAWMTFWKIACVIGFTAFYILVLVVIPIGARDLFRLFRHLSRDRGQDEPAE